MSLHYDRDCHEYHCTECGQVYEHIGTGAGDEITYTRSGVTHVTLASDGCHRCRTMEENERMAKPINKELADALKASEAKPHQPMSIGRMKLRSKITDYGTGDWSQLAFECTDCNATVEADESTANGVITAWDEEYHDCPYCVVKERTEADMTTLPDFGAF